MSAGSSALGTLLVQRLDAVLGTTLAQQANLMSGARSDAVSQAAQLARIGPDQDATHTDVRHSVERVAQHADPRLLARDVRCKAASDSEARLPDGVRTPSAPTQLGHVARLILALLAQYPNRAPQVMGRRPLAEAEISVATLVRSLAQTVAASGMFYESHLADFAFGKRSLAQLAEQPQAQLLGQDNAAQGGASVAPLHPELALLVRQQIEVLAYQMFCWQGEAWPGVSMSWETRRHDGEDRDQRRDAPAWTSRIKLSLPNLGEVQAKFSLVGDALRLHLSAPDCADVLQAHAQTLRERCAAQGLTRVQLSVDSAIDADIDGVPNDTDDTLES